MTEHLLLDPSVEQALANLFVSDPDQLEHVDIENIEKATLRWVYTAFLSYATEARTIFANSPDLPQDIAEDITRDIFNRYTGYPAEARLWGKVDFKRSQWLPFPDKMVRQALLVDSKAEKGKINNARLQVGQTSLRIKQTIHGNDVDEYGGLATSMNIHGKKYLTCTILVIYHYQQVNKTKGLLEQIFCAIPNGLLQGEYNPSAAEGIWNVGPHAPSRGEEFRTRVSFSKLRVKASWRIQRIAWPKPNSNTVVASWSR